jgi:putative aminopeptidase FrvX
MKLLKQLCAIHAPSGNETLMTEFLLDYIKAEKHNWKTKPEIFSGEGFQNCIVLIFGKPRTAVYAHIDNIGFTVRYNNQLVKIGGPRTETGYALTGRDAESEINCTLKVEEETNALIYQYEREIERGTDLSFKANFREDETYVQSPYMDNRLGVYNALHLCESLENGAICFSCWEEHGGGSTNFIARFLFENYNIKQALISDITWVTEGVLHGRGVAVSMRDSGIPRRVYVHRIIDILKKNNVAYQLEVESSGGSDGNELQKTPYPIDWCFVGAPEDFVHTPDEKVHKDDIKSMLKAYEILMQEL